VTTRARSRIDDAAGRTGSIFAGRNTEFESRFRKSPATHDFAVLLFYVGGGASMQLRSTWTVTAGDVLVVPPGEPHRGVESQHCDVWHLGFCVPCLASETSSAVMTVFERVRDGASPVVPIPADRRLFLESLFRELSAEGGDDLVRQSLLTLILSEVKRAAGPMENGGESSLVNDTLRYIERNCLRPLTLNAVAKAMKRTPSYITTMLTRATGRSAVAWIIAGRMAEARRHLLHSGDSVDAIAERVGYADPTHFIRLFRRTHGATPAAWRAMNRPASPAPASARDSAAPRRSSPKRQR
jgi:AraC family transcriptional regulator, transcriptional activator of pobA